MSRVQLVSTVHDIKTLADFLYDVLTKEFVLHFPCELARPMSICHIA